MHGKTCMATEQPGPTGGCRCCHGY